MLIQTATATLTRPADNTAYASGDLVANSATAGSVTPLSFALPFTSGTGQTILQRVRVSKNNTNVSNATFRLHLYAASPTVSNGDNAAWLSTQAANYLGFIDCAAMLAFSDGGASFGSAAAGAEMRLKLPSGSTVYGLVEARAAYAPPAGAETFTFTLETLDGY